MQAAEIARVCHEANRAIQHATGDPNPSPAWNDAPDWQQESAVDGVVKAQEGATPRELHESWCEFKTKDGWVWGPIKDEDAKTHPCLVDYDELPESQRVKDHVFSAIVDTLTDWTPVNLGGIAELKAEHDIVPVPTVGRIVHFYPWNGPHWPRAAIVTAINRDGCRPHLSVFETWGEMTEVSAVEYSPEPKAGHWTWPPRV